MKKSYITRIAGLLLIAAGSANAQVDPHFSQYYANPLWLNPALTGVINADLRINANYKSQWASVNNAYQTTAISGDFRPTEKIGIGVTILNQSAGSGSYNHFQGYGSFSYSIRIGQEGNQRVSFGMQAGMINRSFSMNELQFASQFEPGSGFNPALNSMENFGGGSKTVFDANAGLFFYDGDPLKKFNFFGGVSAGHVSRPMDPIAGISGANNKIPIRYAFHGGMKIKAGPNFDVTPNALYITQQQSSIKAVGVSSELKFGADRGLMIGGLYRFEDAAIANVGYRFSNLVAGASYDFNTSTLNRATNGQGGIELSVSYVFRKRIREPEPVCPRL